MNGRAPVAVLLLVYLAVGTLYAVYTPEWQAPDEPAHYNYIAQLAAGQWPIIEPGDYDQAYQSEVISSGFADRYSVTSFEYEDYQPPLYYLLQTPVFLAFDGSLTALRLSSLVFGAGIVLLAYGVARRLFPQHKWLALTVAAFVAFLPQHVAMLAAVNNDSLSELLIAAILFLVLRLRPAGDGGDGVNRRVLLALGLILGLGFLTKATVYLMAPINAAALLWRFWGRWSQLAGSAALVFGLAFLIGFPWWTRNVLVYDDLDPLGIGAHNKVVTGQPRTEEWIDERGLGATLGALVQTTFQSFWGQFGWMGVVMPGWVYQILLAFTLLTLTGAAWMAWRQAMGRKWPGWDAIRDSDLALAVTVMGGTLLLSVALLLTYNVTFVQHQGRYLFPALIPIGLLVALAWSTLAMAAGRRWPAAAYLLPLALALGLVGLDLLALFRFIVPSLT